MLWPSFKQFPEEVQRNFRDYFFVEHELAASKPGLITHILDFYLTDPENRPELDPIRDSRGHPRIGYGFLFVDMESRTIEESYFRPHGRLYDCRYLGIGTLARVRMLELLLPVYDDLENFVVNLAFPSRRVLAEDYKEGEVEAIYHHLRAIGAIPEVPLTDGVRVVPSINFSDFYGRIKSYAEKKGLIDPPSI